MGLSGKPVFLSYASQDVEAARHIADALREAGLEVWFDQSELRGGDAWDSLIRRQVKECALFVPLISANTESRSEGYFRLEWKLAVDRSHLMADDQAFLLPIVVDDTREATARVPDGFRSRQWTRLPGGHATAQFGTHVKHLLDGVPVPGFSAPAPHAATSFADPPPQRRDRSSRRRIALIGGSAVLAITVLLVVFLRPSREERVSSSPVPAPATVPATAPAPQVAAAELARPAEDARPPASAPARPRNEAPATVAQPRGEERAKIQVAKIDLMQPAVAHESDIQPIRLVSNAPVIGAPQESAVWHVQVELSFWETIKSSTMVEDFEEYLKQYPDGRFAGLAKNRIRALRTPRK
jgi:hypothetical protein